MHEYSYTLDTLDTMVTRLTGLKSHCSIFTFSGPLGAGKTTLIKRLLAHWGVTELVTSPTFTYVALYRVGDFTFYHFDLYRLKTLSEFMEAGFDEYLYEPKSVSLIEWPGIIEPLLTHKVCKISLDYSSQTERILRYHCIP
jgi:tRNA threonylcarbamoyladenosine biosynthesis protein TsaE